MQLKPHDFQIDEGATRYNRGRVDAWCQNCGVEVQIQYGYGRGNELHGESIIDAIRREVGTLCCGSPESRAEYEMIGQKFEGTKAEIQEMLDTQVEKRNMYHEHTFVFDTDYIKFGEPS